MTETATRPSPTDAPRSLPAPPRLDDLRIDRGDERGDGARRLWPWLLLALVLLATGGAWLALRPRPPLVRTAAVAAAASTTTGAASVLDASGYVTARRQATVSSKVTGKVTAVLVEEGSEVAAGQLLARLDAAIPEAAQRLAESQVAAAGSAREETQVRIAQARLDLRRQQELVAEGFTSQAEVDSASHDLGALEAHLQAQDDELVVAERSLALRRQDVADTEIRAPFAGVVTSKNAQPGEMISPMSAGGGFTRTGICTLVDMGSLELEVDVNESYIHRVRPAQPVVAVLDAYPAWRIPAHVITIVPTADRQKATVMVRIAIDQHDSRILPDMGVKVSFVEPQQPGAPATPAVTVPRAALRRDGERDVVLVVAADTLERRAVQVADSTGDRVRVTAGLVPGERVVVDGAATLHEGDRVRVAADEEEERK